MKTTAKIRELATEHKTPWSSERCRPECWCHVISNANTKNDDNDYVAASGCVNEKDAKFICYVVNNAARMADLIEMQHELIMFPLVHVDPDHAILRDKLDATIDAYERFQKGDVNV